MVRKDNGLGVQVVLRQTGYNTGLTWWTKDSLQDYYSGQPSDWTEIKNHIIIKKQNIKTVDHHGEHYLMLSNPQPSGAVLTTMSVTATAGHSGHHGAGHSGRRRGSPEECRYAVPASACGLVIGRGGQSIQEIERSSGARVKKDNNQSPAPGFEIFVISGTRPQIMKAVKLIFTKAGIGNLLAEEAQAFWLKWVERTYPDLETQTYFVPAAHINRVPMTKRRISGKEVHILQRKSTQGDSTLPTPHVQETDMAIDAAVGRVVFSLQKMAETHKDEVFMAISQMNFGDYLGETCYMPVAALLPHPSNLPESLPRNWRQGSFDLLIIHRHYGIIVCEIKALGDSEETSSEAESESTRIRKKLRRSVSQLDKAEAMLSYLVSDVAPGLSITKTIALPNLTSCEVQQVISADPDLVQELHRCLNTNDITGACIFSDQLSSPTTPWEPTDDILWRLKGWWEQCVISSGVDPLMTSAVYKTLVARFCGPATSVKVPCLSEPRLCVKTLGQAVSETGGRYALITLFPEQVDLLTSPPPRVFLAGPPGTGKTVVLVLIAMHWLKGGHEVYVLSTWINSRVVCRMLYHLLNQWLRDQGQSSQHMGTVHFIHFDFRGGKETNKAFDYLKEATGGYTSVYVIADEVGPDEVWSPEQDYPSVWSQHLWKFCHRLLQEVPDLHFWAANCKHDVAPPDDWKVEIFTRPLRSPPTVVTEVALSEELGCDVAAYTERGVPDHTHGPPVKLIYHHGPSHDEEHPRNCVQCGKDVASFITSLGVGQTDDSSSLCEALALVATASTSPSAACPPALQFRDVLVLCVGHVDDDSGVVVGLRSANIPTKVMESMEDMEDVATARSDVVWVSYGNVARGIERKVVVCVRDDYHDTDKYNRLYPLSRCMAQLVLVLPPSPGAQTQDQPISSLSFQTTTLEPVDEAVAIVGIGAITPGAENIRDFWRLLKNGENHITDVPASRWNADAFYDSDPMTPGKTYVKKAGFVKDVEKFDNLFFEINDYEAASLDPQQSLVLECTHMALENGGFTRTQMAGTNTGVFIGAMTTDHATYYLAGSPDVDSYTATGVNNSMLAGRVSFVYNLLGPSMVIDTASSSSLVAIHQGIQAIKHGDCDMAICGGVNYIGAPTMFVQLSKTKMLSPTGQSRAFSADADGYVRGEGCGIVVLKRLKDALDNNDHIWATVVSGVNQDGHTVTPVTAPSGTQQEKLMRDIYTKYGVDVSRLDYIEAHGTGTQAGDPVEVNAVGNVLKAIGEPRTRYIGSVKTNIGNLEAGAGVIGVIKVLLMMKHNTIVPSLNCQIVNPLIDLEDLGLVIPRSIVKWESKHKMACCSSFGFGGTNSHVVLQTFCKPSVILERRSSNVVCFSGKTKQSLKGSMETIRDMEFFEMSDATDDESENILLTNIAYMSSVKRDHHAFRKAFVVNRMQNLFHYVSLCLENNLPLNPPKRQHLVFVFCGMGTAGRGMCLQMMEEFPVFKETIVRVDTILTEINKTDPWSLVDRLSKEDPSTDPVLSPIAVFACQVALVDLWKSLGVSPVCVVGQSVGEVAAAYTAGCLSLEAAVKVIYYRSKVLAQVAGGQMTVVKNMSVEKIREILRVFDKASIAVEYSPVCCAVSADSDTMAKIHRSLIPHLYFEDQLSPLNVPVAYHSQFVESCKPELAKALDKLEAKSPKISYISAVTGEKMTSAPGKGYWVNHLREPVLFDKAIQTARKESPTNTVFVEIGPRAALKAHLKDIFPTEDIPLIQSMYSPLETNVFLQSVASLYELGVEVTWAALYKGSHDIVDVPRYSFDKKISLKRSTARALIPSGTEQVNHHPYLSQVPKTNNFKITLSTMTTSFVYDHTINNRVLVPGAVYVEAGLAVAFQLRYDPYFQAVVSADFMSPVSANIGEFMELELKSETDLNTENKQHLGISVRKQERDIAIIHIEWQPVIPTTQRTINLQYIRDKCTVCVQKNEIYSSLKRLGFEYGKTFSLLEKAYRGEGECLAQMKVISEVSKDFVTTTIHPCVLDAMFQSVVVINDGSSHLQLLPDAVKRLKVFGAMETVMYVHSRFIRDDGNHTSYKLTLLSPKGLVLATVEEFVLIRINAEDHCSLTRLMAIDWTHVCKTWDADTCISEDAFILHTKQSPEIIEAENVTCLRLSDHARDWDEIYDEVKTVMQEAASAPAIVVVCHMEFPESVNCEDLDILVLNTCGAVHSVLRLALDLNFKMPVYICTNGAWPAVGSSSDQVQVNPAATCVWGMIRTVQVENVYPHLVIVDLHIPVKLSSPEFFSLMAESLSRSHELRDNSEFLITTEAVYVNRINLVDKHTTVPLLRDLPFDLYEDFLVVSNDAEVLSNEFAVRTSAPTATNTCNVTIIADSFSFPSPSLTKAPIVYNKSIAGPNKYLVFALETVGQLNQEHNNVIVSCCPVQAGRRVSVPKETIVPASFIPDYRLGDLTKLVLLFALSERVSTDNVTILTSDNHVGLARVMKMKLETDNRTRLVNVEKFRNLNSMTIQSETVVSFILLDSDIISTLVGHWSNAKHLVTCDALITSEALAYLAYILPEVDIESVDTQLLFKPYKLKHFVVEVKSWLEEEDEQKLSNISRYIHSLENADVVNSEICENMLSRMLSLTELNLRNMTVKVDFQNVFRGNSVYIVVGGLEGLGWIVVKFLARHGARNIAIIHRRTPSADHCSNIERMCSQFHCIIRVFQAEVTIRKSVEEVLSRVGESFDNAALKGLFFDASVADDGAFPSMNREKFDKALAPKVKGAWNFHLRTKHLPLDFFVMHSSAASVLGNQGQANYSAGNAFLDGLAYYRRHLGLAAQSFSWGPLATELFDNKQNAQCKLEYMGFFLMSEAEIDESLSPLLMLNWPHCAPIKLDEKRFFARLKASGIQHFIKRFQFPVSPDVTTPTFDNIDVAAAKAKDPAARLELYRSFVRQLASRMLTVDQSLVTLDTNLADLGMDSVSFTIFIDQLYWDTKIRLNSAILISGEATVGNIAQTLTDNTDSSSETI